MNSACERFAHGDKTLPRYILFPSHRDIFKNIQDATQIRHVMRLQNTLFIMKNVKLAADKESVVWQFPSLHGRSLNLDAL